MAEHANTFLLLTILVLVTILLVFGMKYFSAARTVHARANGEEAYRELAEKAVALQAANAASQAAIQADCSEMKTRLTAIEKLLRDVE
jgi:Tfp pilus assembly protein PilO